MAEPKPNGSVRGPRAVALVGPYGSGKSTLFEALMLAGGASLRRADPRSRSMGTEIRLGHCSFLGEAWAILDCPARSSSPTRPKARSPSPISRSWCARRPRRAPAPWRRC